jgi:hypothetical protein
MALVIGRLAVRQQGFGLTGLTESTQALWTCHFSSSWRSLQAGLGQLLEVDENALPFGPLGVSSAGHSETKEADVSEAADLDSTLSSRGRALLLLHRWSELKGEAAGGGDVQVQSGDPTAWFANGSGLTVLCAVEE